MLTIVKGLFKTAKDVNGQKIDQVIARLAAQYKSNIYSWSYIQEESFYENTVTGKRIYAYELLKKAA